MQKVDKEEKKDKGKDIRNRKRMEYKRRMRSSFKRGRERKLKNKHFGGKRKRWR